MRIQSTSNRGYVGSKGKAAKDAPGGERFSADSSGETHRAGGSAPAQAATAIDSILALQSVDDPLLAKKRAIKHGHSLLDVLEEVKADLLVGQVSEGRLNRMLSLVSRAREAASPDLEALIGEIDLRVRVELAKFGRYAN